MPDDVPECLRALLKSQDGVLTRAQALGGGMTEKAIKVRLRSGRWQRLQLGVYAAFSGEPPQSSLIWAAVLRCGPDAVLSHQTAAELSGLMVTPGHAIHVSVPSGTQIARIPGVVLHYSGRLSQTRHPVLEPARTRIEETVLDLGQAARALDRALGWVFLACGSRKTTAERIAAAMALRPRVRWRTDLAMALDVAREGAHSLLEFRYVNRVERPHGFPAGIRQHQVQRGGRYQYQDVLYEAFGMVVELDGRAAHPEEYRLRDVRRDNANIAVGQVTLRYTWADVTQRSCAVAAEVSAALSQRGWTGAPRRCGPHCTLPRY
jgi:very-short-patch-repair endonuclease